MPKTGASRRTPQPPAAAHCSRRPVSEPLPGHAMGCRAPPAPHMVSRQHQQLLPPERDHLASRCPVSLTHNRAEPSATCGDEGRRHPTARPRAQPTEHPRHATGRRTPPASHMVSRQHQQLLPPERDHLASRCPCLLGTQSGGTLGHV
jgi:hypothetical protein